MNHEFSVGSIRCRLVSDGTDLYPPEVVFANVEGDELTAALVGVVDNLGLVPSCYSPVLVASADRLALLDTGLGQFAETEGAPAGHLVSALAAAGVQPTDIDTVVISHGHPDHVGGLTRAAGERRVPVYGKATHYISRTEWDTWTTAGDTVLPPEFAEVARLSLLPLAEADLLQTVDDDDAAILPGIRLVPAPGHTPGHLVVEITSGDETALYLGDAIVHELNVEHPDWLGAFDMEPATTIATRRHLLERAVRDAASVLAFHLPGPGRVQREGDGYRWVAVD